MTTTRTQRPRAAHHDHAFEQGVTALTILSRLHGRGVTPEEVRQHCKGDVFDVTQMLNCGRALGMKLRAHNSDWRACRACRCRLSPWVGTVDSCCPARSSKSVWWWPI